MTTQELTEAKARLYKTAFFSAHAHELEPRLPSGPIRVMFMTKAWNAMYLRHECVFACYTTMEDTSYIGSYFENALERFVL